MKRQTRVSAINETLRFQDVYTTVQTPIVRRREKQPSSSALAQTFISNLNSEHRLRFYMFLAAKA
jgi:hypothetical protein